MIDIWDVTVFTLVDLMAELAFPPPHVPQMREKRWRCMRDLEGAAEAPIEMRWAGPFSRAGWGERLGSPSGGH
jgi:hypothetical protein